MDEIKDTVQALIKKSEEKGELEFSEIMGLLRKVGRANKIADVCELFEDLNIRIIGRESISRELIEDNVNAGCYDANCTAESAYLRDIGKIPLLTKEEEIELSIRRENGDKAAFDLLVESNLRLVVSIANNYKGNGMYFLDLIQEGNLGLMKAVQKFDYRKGCRFSTYATHWIKQGVRRAISEQARTIRLPVHVIEQRSKYHKVHSRLSQELEREPLVVEIAKELGLPVYKVNDIIKSIEEPVSLETPLGTEGRTDGVLSDFIEDEKTETPSGLADTSALREQLDDVLSTLTDREGRILKMRYGLDDNHPKTLEEVGKEFDITRERVRQIEAKALRKLRHPIRSKRIQDFV